MLPSVLKNTKFNILADFVVEKLAVLREKTAKLDILNIEEVSPKFLDLLAWQFHVDIWRSDLPIESKRELIKNNIKWHTHKGTPWAVKKALEWFGIEAEIIEYWQARKKYEELGGIRLDGSWKLDGTKKLIPYYNITALSYMSNWAEFCVKLNLASMEFTGWDKLTKQVVNVAKNVRSWSVYVYFIGLEIQDTPIHTYFLLLEKQIDQSYPWCTKKLDGSWKIGIDDRIITLNGKKLDGTWHLGEILKGLAYIKLRQCNIFYNFDFLKETDLLEKYIIPKVGEDYLRLNGAWQLGKNPIFPLGESKLDKDLNIYAEKNITKDDVYLWELKYPKNSFKLSSIVKLNFRRLGNFKIGENIWKRKLDGKWQIINEKKIEISEDHKIVKEISAGIYKRLRQIDELEKIKLNGKWKLGRKKLYKGNEKVFFKLDGTWKIGETDYQTGTEKNIIKQIFLKKDQQVYSEYSDKKSVQIAYPGSSKVGTIKKLSKWNRLDGSWNIGETFGTKLGNFFLGRDTGIIAENKCFAEIYGEIGIFRKLGSPFFKIGEYRFRKVNGSWKVSAYRKLDGEWKLNEGIVLGAPHLGKIYTKLNKFLQLGATKRLNGCWKIGVTGIEAK